MAKRRPHFVWTAYRKHFVRELLMRGTSLAVIAYRLGLSVPRLRYGITAHGLDKPEAGHG